MVVSVHGASTGGGGCEVWSGHWTTHVMCVCWGVREAASVAPCLCSAGVQYILGILV